MSNRNFYHDLSEPIGPADHVLGPAAARVAIVEYADFECPSCKHAAPAVRMMLTRFGKQVRFAFRHFPVEEFHPHALAAAEAAECAGAQGKFWEMHDLLFENQSRLDSKHLHLYGVQLGLDMTRFAAAMDEHIYLWRVREDIDSGKRSTLRATPGFFVNGKIQDVSFGLQGLLDAIEAELAKQ